MFNKRNKIELYFIRFFQNKETLTFPQRMINTVAKCVAIPNGTNMATLDDFFKAIIHRPLLAKVGIREYNGKESNVVNAIYESKYPNVMHKFKDEEKQGNTQGFGQFGNFSETNEEIPF